MSAASIFDGLVIGVLTGMVSGLYSGLIMTKYSAFNDYKTRLCDITMKLRSTEKPPYKIFNYDQSEIDAIRNNLYIIGHKEAYNNASLIYETLKKYNAAVTSETNQRYTGKIMEQCIRLAIGLRPDILVFIRFWKPTS